MQRWRPVEYPVWGIFFRTALLFRKAGLPAAKSMDDRICRKGQRKQHVRICRGGDFGGNEGDGELESRWAFVHSAGIFPLDRTWFMFRARSMPARVSQKRETET